MKRGTIDHPKLRALVKALPVTGRYQAVGILESLWHFTALYAWRGDVGRHSDQAIAEWIGWQGSPAALIEPLVSEGWLDRTDGPERLVVHDWAEHCDESVKKRMQREAVHVETCPPAGETCPSDGETCPDLSGHVKPRAGGRRQKAEGLPRVRANGVAFDPETCKITGVSELDRQEWAAAYPAVDVGAEVLRAEQWLKDNPAKRKKNVRRFLTNWMSRKQERGGERPAARQPDLLPSQTTPEEEEMIRAARERMDNGVL